MVSKNDLKLKEIFKNIFQFFKVLKMYFFFRNTKEYAGCPELGRTQRSDCRL